MEDTQKTSSELVDDLDLSTDPNTNVETPINAEGNHVETNTDIIEDEILKSVTASSNEVKLTHLPLSRIKHIMKLDSDITIVPLECVFLVTKATELFVQSLAREACTFTQQNDKKTLQKRDIDSAISQIESLIFLEETL